MRAARWHARRDIRIEDVPRPRPAPGELLLKVSWCGICGTDVEEYTVGPVIIPTEAPNDLTGRSAPLTLGHEFVGTVAEVGDGVTGFAPGERVAPEVVLFCGNCFFCRRHEYALCRKWAALGLQADGGLAEYAVVPAFSCVRLPDTLSDEEGALVEPTEVAVRAVRRSRLRLGETVAVLGGGTIGLLAVQAARAAGASAVFLVEPRASRRNVGEQVGATATFDPARDDWQAMLRDRCTGVGPDIVIECATGPTSADLAVRMARKGGRIVLLGIQSEPVQINTMEVIVGEKQVVGSVQHHYDEDLPAAVQLLGDGRIDAKPLVSARIPLTHVVEQGFEALAHGDKDYLKVLVDPSA